jgi:undecaprenyl-diphosphatase
MPNSDLAAAAVLGLVEGLTEFLPISSTGHLILLTDILGFKGPPGRIFEVVIQFGAILAICWLYRHRIVEIVSQLPRDPSARRFAVSIGIAILPAIVLGAIFHEEIKRILFTPTVVAGALIAGGLIILLVERLAISPRVLDVAEIRPGTALRIGLCQSLALVPGTSRSGATIIGGLLFGLSRRAAAEFSFFLAIPTMLAATLFDFYGVRDTITWNQMSLILVGFVFAFIAAILSVKCMIAFVSRNGFSLFAWYRIVLGTVILLFLT